MLEKKYTIFNVILSCIIICSLIYRVFYSVELTDEVSGIAEIYNHSFGKKPFIDVWDYHIGWFLYVPFFNIFRLISPQLEGIVLYFRIIYLVLAFSIGYITYRISSRNIPLLAVLGCLGYVSFSIPNMGYWSVISFLFILEFGVLYAYKLKQALYLCIIAGLISGLACLFYPTVSIMVLLISPVVWKLSKQKSELAMLLYVFGVAVVGITFFIWLLSGAKGSINALMTGIKVMLLSPHELSKGTIDFDFLKLTFYNRLSRFYTLPRTIIWIIFFLINVVDVFINSEHENKAKHGLIGWTVFIIVAWTQIITDNYVPAILRGGYICYTVLISAILFTVSQWRNVKHISILPIGIAIAWVLTCCFTSDNKNIFAAMDTAGNLIMFSACFVGTTMKINTANNDNDQTGMTWHNALIPLSVLALSIMCFYGYVYRDAPVSQLHSCVETGIYKGLYTTKDRAEYVKKLEGSLKKIAYEDETVFLASNMPCIYLMLERRPLCPQTWDAQFLYRGYTSAAPVLSYFNCIGEKPSIVIANNYLFPKLFDNKSIEIWDFIGRYYDEVTTLDFGKQGLTKIWRLKK